MGKVSISTAHPRNIWEGKCTRSERPSGAQAGRAVEIFSPFDGPTCAPAIYAQMRPLTKIPLLTWQFRSYCSRSRSRSRAPRRGRRHRELRPRADLLYRGYVRQRGTLPSPSAQVDKMLDLYLHTRS